jgi:signal transduction histidine kinase
MIVPILLVIACLDLILAYVIFWHNKSYKNKRNLFFIYFSIATAFWTVGCAGVLRATDPLILTISYLLFIFAPAVSAFFIKKYSDHYESDVLKNTNRRLIASKTAGTICLAIAVVSLVGYLNKDLVGNINGEPRVLNSSLYTLYGAYFSICFLYAYINFALLIKKAPSREQRINVSIVFIGILIASSLTMISNILIPTLSGSLNTIWAGPTFTLAFISLVAYGMLKHRLFGVKASAFRAVGYSLSIATIVAIYSIIIYGLVLPIISPETGFELETLIMIIVGTAATIFFFDKVKLIFDAITDRLFFKNSYSLPKFLDEFNQALINSSDIGELANSIFKVMENNLKTEFFVLMVKEGNFEITIDSRKNESLREVDAKVPLSLINYHFKSGTRVVLSDFLDKQKFEGLAQDLSINDASAAIDLSEASKATSSLKKALESGNFKALILGPKRSGESYNSQDLDAFRIISKELVIALQNAMRFEEIKLFNLELQHKVDLATAKLRQQNKKLVVADELKDDFLSIASHQMRTPISAINGYASILNSGDAGKLNKDQQKFAKIIQDSTKKLSYLINDFLTVSRLKSGKFSIEKRVTDLKEMLKGEAENLDNQFKQKGLELKLHIDNALEPIQADESKLRQVMMNFIDNAMHYTESGGKINVTLKKVGNFIVFEVKDSGIGVPKKDQAELFSKMFRAGNAKRMRPDGTGLGLYLAQKVIVGHNGHVIFASKEGEGSTFGFKIPVK